MNDSLAADLLGRLGGGLSQHARLLTLESALPLALVAESLVAHEAVNALFSIEVQALSGSASVDVTQLLGEQLTVTLLQPDHSRRAWHGICTEAEQVGADGGMARYRLLLEPALHALRLRRDSYIFQNKDVRAVVMELLADYPLVRCEFDVSAALPVRPICTQYEESDFAFFARVLAADGLSWRFEHGPVGGEHKLVIFDAGAVAPVLAGGAVLRFHGVRAADSDDAIDRFGARRELMANAVAVSSWDPAGLIAPAAEWRSSLDAGELPELSIYEGGGERLLADAAHADARGEAMLKALELASTTFEGAGAVRRLAAGRRFTLSQHERFGYGSNEFTVLAVRHEARNNFQPGVRSARGVEAGTYRNSFTCVRSSAALVPPAVAALRAPSAPGPQTAVVVGMANSVATTNRDHQVLVQFGWQRGTRPNDGGLAHDLDADGCAPGDDASGSWVRVAEALAGPNWGSVFTPRIGTETLIDFVDGDIDRPLVVGQLYNGADRPPFPAGEDSGANHPGVLSGIHARGFDGAGYAQWVADDSAGQLRMRLASSCADSRLDLGYLVRQAHGSTGCRAYRGSGFEMRTDAWTAIRGALGVLVTTAARSAHACGVSSSQMDAVEARRRFQDAGQLGFNLRNAAEQQDAASVKADGKAFDSILGMASAANKTANRHAAKPDNRASRSRSPEEERNTGSEESTLGQATVAIDSAANLHVSTPNSTAICAGRQTSWTSQRGQQLSAAHSYASVSANAAALFTHGGGLQALAANGSMTLQANRGQLDIVADGHVTVFSIGDQISIKGSKSVALQAGACSLVLDGSDITFLCPGKFTARAGSHQLDAASSQEACFIPLPNATVSAFRTVVRLIDATTGEVLSDSPYYVRLKSGVVFFGDTDSEGKTDVAHSDTQELAQILTGHDALIEIAKMGGK